jgi:TorA maturation chaperone TorD
MLGVIVLEMDKMRSDRKLTQQETAESRSNLYRFLGLVYLGEVKPELLKALTSEDCIAAFEDFGASLRELRDKGHDRLLEELAEEYAALFIAPGGIPPYESVRLTGLLNQEPACEVEAFYRRCGLQLREDCSVLPDHLGMELAFMGHLAAMEGGALEEGDEGGVSQWIALQEEFFARHLGRWAIPYLQDLMKYAAHPLYREMAGLTIAFLETERDSLSSVMPA